MTTPALVHRAAMLVPHPPPLPSAVRGVLAKVYSKGKWVVQWDHLIAVPGLRLAYFVLGASHGRVYVLSMHRMPKGELSFEGLYQLPLDWHGGVTDSDLHRAAARGERHVGDKKAVIEQLELRARGFFHITGDFADATAPETEPGKARSFERWLRPPEGYYWRWRSTAPVDSDLTSRALTCALQHPLHSGKPRKPCAHCEYPFDGTGRRALKVRGAADEGSG